MRGVSLILDGLKIQGFSRAGDQTWFRVDPPGLALDVGRGAPALVGARWIFLSHSHLDHTSGIAWVLTQRQHQGLDAPTIFCPLEMRGDLVAYLEAAGRLEGEPLRAKVEGLEGGESRELERGLRLEAFATTHSVPGIGCHLLRTRSKLLPEFEGMAPSQIAGLKREGVEVTRGAEDLWMSYCGDSSAEVFDREPRLFEAEILLIECTFMGPETRPLGKRFGHLHLQDLAARSSRFRNAAVVLYHLSRRHRLAEFERAVERELGELANRIHVIGGDEAGAGQ